MRPKGAPIAAPTGRAGDAPPGAREIMLAALSPASERFAALCGRGGIDWMRVAAEAELHRVGPSLLYAIQHGGAVEYVPAGALAELRRQWRAAAALGVRLDAAISALLPALAARGVPALVLKGAVLARLYPSPSLRPRSDVDLLVEPRHWPAAHEVLNGLGFELMEPDHVTRPALSGVQAPEDRQYVRSDGAMVELHAEYLSTGLRRREDAAVWRRARAVGVEGRAIPTLAPGDTFLQMTAHMQRHAYTRLAWFYDLALLLRAEGDRMAWGAIASRAERSGVKAAAWFGLCFAEDLFGRLAPPEASAALRPNRLRRRLHEATWPASRVLALDTAHIRGLDQHMRDDPHNARIAKISTFDPYAPTAVMVKHLLLSGNPWPKLALLLRRLVPREEWLLYHGPREVRLYGVRLALSRLIARLRAAISKADRVAGGH